MKLTLINREQISGLGAFLVNELDSIIARIRGAWNVEHNEDDTHGNVHATSIATGRLTFSTIVTDAITATNQLDNYNQAGLDAAALLRISTLLPVVDITGIKVPQDAAGNVIDGRVLTIENTSVNSPLRLFNEHTSSLQRNRIGLPWTPAGAETQLQWHYLMPGSVTILIYNASRTRWILHGQTNDEIRMTATFGASQNDYNPSGFRSSKYISLGATAASLNITGFDGRVTSTIGIAPGSTNIPYPSTKTITNDGIFEFDILHMSSSSFAENRVACPGSVRYRLHPRESVTLYRSDFNTWKIAEKADQWIDVTFAAGNFTTDAGSWTLTSGDQTTYTWQLDGNKMTVAFDLRTTTVATNPTQLRIAVPRGKIIARTVSTNIIAADNGAQINTAYVQALVGNTFLQCFKDLAGTAWAAATDTTQLRGEITFMVRDDCTGISESHSDILHGDAIHGDIEHSDVAHTDVAHGDLHSDASHADISHSDMAHSDIAHSDTPHSDIAHIDVTGCNTGHSDTPHSDSPHTDTVDTHSDTPHLDHTDLGSAQQHDDVEHGDGGSPHADISHGDISHADVDHCDTPHTDSGHSDVAHTDSHSDSAHADIAHTDGGHVDSHSDTAPHSDVAHVDVSHSDTIHADAAHADVGYHCDTAHSDI